MQPFGTTLLLLAALLGQPAAGQQSPAKAAASSPSQPLTISDLVVKQVLEPLRIGMITHNLKTVLSVFDKNELTDSTDFEGHLQAFFRQFQETNFRYQLLQAAQDKERASAIVLMEMDAYPYETTSIAVRRSVQMRMQLKLTPTGWKIASFAPSDFFNVEYNGTKQQ